VILQLTLNAPRPLGMFPPLTDDYVGLLQTEFHGRPFVASTNFHSLAHALTGKPAFTGLTILTAARSAKHNRPPRRWLKTAPSCTTAATWQSSSYAMGAIRSHRGQCGLWRVAEAHSSEGTGLL